MPPGPGRRRRGAHRDRRLSLVHRLGPRHHDQPGRADADHRPALEAGYILRTFAHYVRDGLIPNLFPEGEKQGLYHTADATLWFFHALDRYLAMHRRPAKRCGSSCRSCWTSSTHHLRGTRFGIGVDPTDGLLRQGAEGYQLTWMDAKVGDWVVTPRRGKAVEINALWYNALRLLERLAARGTGRRRLHGRVGEQRRARARRSFNERFWYADGRLSLRRGRRRGRRATMPSLPAQPALRHLAAASGARSNALAAGVEVVKQQLLTPVGLRSLAPGNPDYKPTYYGDLRARDAAYHQGTVWAWLIGPFIDAWLKVHPDDQHGRAPFPAGVRSQHLAEACIGSISEIFDAEAAVHAARLHRPGVERGRGAALLGEDGGVIRAAG